MDLYIQVHRIEQKKKEQMEPITKPIVIAW